MANASNAGGEGRNAEPAGLFKSPTQLVTVVTTALVVPVAVIGIVVGYMGNAAVDPEMTPEAIEARIRPVAGFELKEVKKGGPARAGEVVFKGVCAACHDTGVSGAPKYGDAAAWAPRIAQGLDTLLNSAMKGKGAMAPQSGGEYTDQEIANAVVYLANAGGGSFEAPKLEADKPAEGE
ncbi:MAG: c-type cytochrome [Lautropia sp.]|nr:c-type cytochrome [Lautropia sp.]